MDKSILRCYLVAGTQDCRHLPQYDASQPQQTLLERLEQALKAGITCYQFREKGQFSLQDPQQIEQLARQCQHLCKQYNVPFIMNNDVQLAEKLHADGIHVGQKILPWISSLNKFKAKCSLVYPSIPCSKRSNTMLSMAWIIMAAARFSQLFPKRMPRQMWGSTLCNFA